MTRKPLSELKDWKLEHREQDIRGWPLTDGHGAELGVVDDLIVNTDTEYVDAIRLRSGAEVSTSRIAMGDRKVMLQDEAGRPIDRETLRDARGEIRLPIIEEQVSVGKREVSKGGIRVTTQVHERPVEEQVTLRDEEVHVDRRKVDRPATDADIDKMRDQSFEVHETDEEPVVRKRARVTGEVEISKETDTYRETVRGTERKTDVDVEKLDERERER